MKDDKELHPDVKKYIKEVEELTSVKDDELFEVDNDEVDDYNSELYDERMYEALELENSPALKEYLGYTDVLVLANPQDEYTY